MTSKEFVRRLDLFHTLDMAASLFLDCHYSWIYKVDISQRNSHSTVYTDSVSFIDSLSLIDSDYVIIDCFGQSSFNIQLGYFKGFLARLSVHQRSVLESSHKVDNLLKFCHAD